MKKIFECNACADTENAYGPCKIEVPDFCPPPTTCPATHDEADWVEIQAVSKPSGTPPSSHNSDKAKCEGYPDNWKHCMIHLNPETGEIHSDGDHSVREWIQDKIK